MSNFFSPSNKGVPLKIRSIDGGPVVLGFPQYLHTTTEHYYSFNYYRMSSTNPNHPRFLNVLKNDLLNFTESALRESSNSLRNCLREALGELRIIFGQGDRPLVCLVPRAKKDEHYYPSQLRFKEVLKEVLRNEATNYEDGIECIVRIRNVVTTHARNGLIPVFQNPRAIGRDLIRITPGVTKETCQISNRVRGRNIILVDDIYTRGVNIDEDAIQALYDFGAKSVVLYTVGYTTKEQ